MTSSAQDAAVREALETAAVEIETRAGNKLYLAAWKQAAKLIRARIPKYEQTAVSK